MPIPGAVPASMGKRLLAHVIDTVAALLAGGAFLAAAVLERLLPTTRDGSPADARMLVTGLLLLLAVTTVQWWYAGSRGFTLGKRAVGLRMLSVATGRPVGLRRALVRMLVVAAGVLVLGVGQLAVHASPLWDRNGRRQGWHDRAAGVMVVDVAVGRDPSSVRTDPAHVARRLDGLLGDTRPPRPATAATVAARGLSPAPSSPSSPTRPVPPSPATTTSPTRTFAAPLAARALISSVPAASPYAPGPSSPEGESTVTSTLQHHGLVQAVPGEAGPCAPLDDDVESTRLRPARSKVPSLPACPARATLLLTDGRRIPLSGTALVGRAPVPRPGEDDVVLVTIADPTRSVSKTHLAIGVDAGGVWVRDRASTNGTVVTLADGQQILCAAGQQVRLPGGASVAFGDYGLTVVDG